MLLTAFGQDVASSSGDDARQPNLYGRIYDIDPGECCHLTRTRSATADEGARRRASLEVEGFSVMTSVDARRVVVRSTDWLDASGNNDTLHLRRGCLLLL